MISILRVYRDLKLGREEEMKRKWGSECYYFIKRGIKKDCLCLIE